MFSSFCKPQDNNNHEAGTLYGWANPFETDLSTDMGVFLFLLIAWICFLSVIMCYLKCYRWIVDKINPNFPVFSLCWFSSKDRHLHSFLVIISWNSKSCDFKVFTQCWNGHFNVVMFLHYSGVRVHLGNIPPRAFLLSLSLTVTEQCSAFHHNVPFVPRIS